MAANYKCTSVGCYSVQSPETNALFQKLQALINQFAPSAGVDAIKVDGIIGKGTTQAALVVLQVLIETTQGVTVNNTAPAVFAAATALAAAINGPEDLAGLAQDVVNTLTLAASSSLVSVMPPQSLPAPTPQPSPTQIATTSANKPVSATSAAAQAKLSSIFAGKSKLGVSLLDRVPPWASYVGGAALAIGAIFAVVKFGKHRMAGAASAPAMAGFLRGGSDRTARVYFAETARTADVQITPEVWRKLRELKKDGDTYMASTRGDYLALRPYVRD